MVQRGVVRVLAPVPGEEVKPPRGELAQALRRLFRAAPASEPLYSVVGTVYVRALGSSHHHLVRLEPGTRVRVLERYTRRDQTERVLIADDAGRRGECDALDIWEHIGGCT